MKRYVSFLVIAVFMLAFAYPASAEIKIGEYEDVALFTEIHTVGTAQALDQSNNSGSLTDPEAGIQTAYGNVDWSIRRDDIWEMYFDVTMASRVKNDRWWGHEGWIKLDKLPESSPLAGLNGILNKVDVKAGHYEVDFGQARERRSINANVQNNPLVGNPVVAPNATEPGLEVRSDAEEPFGWLIGTGIGDSTENWNQDRDWRINARVWGNVMPNLKVSGSYYDLDQSDCCTPSHGSGPGHLFTTERIGGRYGGVLGGGDAPGNVMPSFGFDESAWVLDATWNPTPKTEVFVQYGNIEEDDANGDTGTAPSASEQNPKEEWDYYSAEAQHFVSDGIYVSGRYSVAEADKLAGDFTSTTGGVPDETVSSNGEVERIQIGGGAYLTKRVLLKLEYVDQEVTNFNNNTSAMAANTAQDPEFDGVISEVSVTF